MLQQLTGMQVINIYTGDMALRIWPSVEKTLPILIHTLGLFASLQAMQLIINHGRKFLIQRGTIYLAFLSLIFALCFVWKKSV